MQNAQPDMLCCDVLIKWLDAHRYSRPTCSLSRRSILRQWKNLASVERVADFYAQKYQLEIRPMPISGDAVLVSMPNGEMALALYLGDGLSGAILKNGCVIMDRWPVHRAWAISR